MISPLVIPSAGSSVVLQKWLRTLSGPRTSGLHTMESPSSPPQSCPGTPWPHDGPHDGHTVSPSRLSER